MWSIIAQNVKFEGIKGFRGLELGLDGWSFLLFGTGSEVWVIIYDLMGVICTRDVRTQHPSSPVLELQSLPLPQKVKNFILEGGSGRSSRRFLMKNLHKNSKNRQKYLDKTAIKKH